MNKEHFETNQSTTLKRPVKEIPVYIKAALQEAERRSSQEFSK